MIETGSSGNLYFTFLTERQVDLESRIHAVQAKMSELQNQTGEMIKVTEDTKVLHETLQHEIEVLTRLKESSWALGLTDEVPAGYTVSSNPFDDTDKV